MTLDAAVHAGLSRVRLPIWAFAEDYVKLDLLPGGHYGPWGHLYSPGQALLGEPTPQTFLLLGDIEDRWEAYTGPVSKHES